MTGQRVLVTGAGGNLGSFVAALLAARGAVVAVHARTAEKAAAAVARVQQLPQQLGQANEQAFLNTVPLGAEFSDEHSVAAAVTAADAAVGGLTGVVNCVAVQKMAAVDELTATQLREFFAINLEVAHVLTQQAARVLQPGGWITHVSSLLGSRPLSGHSGYAASKAALEMYVRAAALELGVRQLRVNCVAPGLLARPELAQQWPQGYHSWVRNAPLGRVVDPWEVAAATVCLASPALGAVTGQVLSVDCGMGAAPGW